MWTKMKRKHSGYILAVLFLSLCSYIIHIVSEMTESWVVAEASSDVSYAFINYGLYKGTLLLSDATISEETILIMTCLLYLDICALSCQESFSIRREEVLTLYDTGQVNYTCNYIHLQYIHPVTIEGISNKTLEEVRSSFIPGVVWGCTVVCVVLSGLMSLVALALTAYNINHVPTSSWVSIHGLYFWFGASSLLTLFALTIWGVEFFIKLNQNIGTVGTITGILNSDGKAHLGYSYWCQVAVVALQSVCVALLYYRQTLFDTRPQFFSPVTIPPNAIIHVSYISS
uniref:Uncharacterized protein n=1 Tax=Graphocephala atropunctata TaxID=36148 RepID=A0A1B6LLL8_9HEMI